MKLLRVLFSRITLLVLLILIQIAILAGIIYLSLYVLPQAAIYILLAIFVIQIIFFIMVINNDSIPELKIPWITFILALPVLGILSYIFFANHGMPRKQKKQIEKLLGKMENYYCLEAEKPQKMLNENPEYTGIINYLEKVQYMKGAEGNKVTYFKSGEEFFPDMISKLEEAEDFILMEFFIVDYGKEWDKIEDVLKRKAAQGVKVNFIYDDFGCSSTLKLNFCKKMRKAGINCYRVNKFRPVLSGIFNNRDHRKICVIDHKYGYTGGINLADEYANDIVRFGYWKDAMIRIEGPGIHNLIVMFLVIYDVTRFESSNYREYFEKPFENKSNSYVFPFGDGPAPFWKDNSGEQTFINLLNAAKRSVCISSPYLIPTFSLMQALKNAALRGIDVKIVVPGIPDKKAVYLMAKSNFRKLTEAGVKVYTFTPGFNHEKLVIVDDEIAFIGTVNFDYRSLIHHFECGAIVYNSPAIKDMSDSFKDTISKSALVPATFKLNWFKRLMCAIMCLFAPLL